jgi:hypothetical protein
MDEHFLQFIWKHGLYDRTEMRTVSGKSIEVVSCGVHNHNAGPDFLCARIRIGNIMWAGNVEIHQRTSDWNKHHHQNDGAYDSVILHVVLHNDCHSADSCADMPEIYVIKYDQRFHSRYCQLMAAQQEPQCRHLLTDMTDFAWQHFLTELAFERIEQRTAHISALLAASKNDWEQAFLQMLFRAFGFGVNADPLEHLALSITPAHIAKHKDSLLQIEALLFGQAGFLEAGNNIQDEYHRALQREYSMLRTKFGLSPMPKHEWRFLRIRPPNFPTVRIAQLAALLHKEYGLFAKTMSVRSTAEFFVLFNVSVSDYWRSHYSFSTPSPDSGKILGKKSVERLIANVCAPMIYCYGKHHSSEEHLRRAIVIMEALPPEENVHTAMWTGAAMPPHNMLESQALVQLTTEYCHKKRCLHCAVARRVVEG